LIVRNFSDSTIVEILERVLEQETGTWFFLERDKLVGFRALRLLDQLTDGKEGRSNILLRALFLSLNMNNAELICRALELSGMALLEADLQTKFSLAKEIWKKQGRGIMNQGLPILEKIIKEKSNEDDLFTYIEELVESSDGYQCDQGMKLLKLILEERYGQEQSLRLVLEGIAKHGFSQHRSEVLRKLIQLGLGHKEALDVVLTEINRVRASDRERLTLEHLENLFVLIQSGTGCEEALPLAIELSKESSYLGRLLFQELFHRDFGFEEASKLAIEGLQQEPFSDHWLDLLARLGEKGVALSHFISFAEKYFDKNPGNHWTTNTIMFRLWNSVKRDNSIVS